MRLEQKQRIDNYLHQKFQFHKGAIRTPFALLLALKAFNFNSIKVRLEPSLQCMTVKGVFNFNSIKVRLEQGAGWGEYPKADISIP